MRTSALLFGRRALAADAPTCIFFAYLARSSTIATPWRLPGVRRARRLARGAAAGMATLVGVSVTVCVSQSLDFWTHAILAPRLPKL